MLNMMRFFLIYINPADFFEICEGNTWPPEQCQFYREIDNLTGKVIKKFRKIVFF